MTGRTHCCKSGAGNCSSDNGQRGPRQGQKEPGMSIENVDCIHMCVCVRDMYKNKQNHPCRCCLVTNGRILIINWGCERSNSQGRPNEAVPGGIKMVLHMRSSSFSFTSTGSGYFSKPMQRMLRAVNELPDCRRCCKGGGESHIMRRPTDTKSFNAVLRCGWSVSM